MIKFLLRKKETSKCASPPICGYVAQLVAVANLYLGAMHLNPVEA